MKKIAAADVVIIGGGIAGLWLLNKLRQQGLSVFLLECEALGGGQTQKSQGIIHGGMKYALNGILSHEVEALASMPNVWRECLQGNGEINLSKVPILSNKQYLWSPQTFTAKLTGFLASATLNSKVEPLHKDHYPLVFQHHSFKGQLFSLDEIVIDVPILIRELVKENQDVIFKIDPITEEALQFNEQGELKSITLCLANQTVEVNAQQFIFTAGAGNEIIIKKLKRKEVAMQRRPLHMVLVKTAFHYPLYAHCLGWGNRPRITITTHHTLEGDTIWYLGGSLAEDGIHKDSETQIEAARKELATLFPWLDFSTSEFQTFMIDRAEPLQKNGLKPDSSYLKTIKNMTIAWPTKLALAPKLANDILKYLQKIKLESKWNDSRELRAWPLPPLAKPIWDTSSCKNIV